MEHDTDYYGGDLPGGHRDDTDVERCRDLCRAHPRCGTWVQHDRQCWLKVPQVVPSYLPGSTAGMIPSTGSASHPETCQSACLGDAACKAWVLWTGGYGGHWAAPNPP